MESADALETPRSLAETPSRRRIALAVNDMQVGVAIGVACALLSLAGCGGDRPPVVPVPIVTHIFSNPSFDGDIEQTSAGFIVTQGMSPTVQNVLAGTGPTEFRAFLNFPLGGSGGVPFNAFIDSAFLELYVDNVIPINGSVPIRVELVTFQPPTLIGTDFLRSALPPLGAVLVRKCDRRRYRLVRTGRRHFTDDPGTATRLDRFSSADHGGSGSGELHHDGDR